MTPTADGLMSTLGLFLDPGLLALLVAAVALGLVVGAVPGLTATLAIALLLPVTFHLPAVTALIALTGIYIGGIHGGAISAITVRIPGAPANAMTMIDGYAMAEAGRPELALGLATFSSVVGGVAGGLVLVLFAPQLARIALGFQSPEMFSLTLLALVAVATVSESSRSKGLAATVLGLMLSTIGLDKLLAVPRFTLGLPSLLVGVPLLPAVIGLFAVTEFLWQTGSTSSGPTRVGSLRYGRLFEFLPAVKEIGWRLFAKSAAIGAFVGALPGSGAATSAFVAYTEARRSSRWPARFGTGAPEGIAAPETANNAVTGGAFIPMLAFGIPGDAVTAVILGGLLIQGITPGPQLFTGAGALVRPLFIGYFLAYLVLLVIGFGLLPLFARLARVDRAALFPFIAAISMMAAFASERTAFGMWLTLGVGVFGYLLRWFGFPLVPVLLGLLLGPGLETNFRRALVVSGGDPLVFVRSPVSAAILLATVLLAAYVGYRQPRRQAP